MADRKFAGDMTDGPIAKNVILYALPLLLSDLLQQLYSAFDSLIVGNYVGKSALAAVSSTYSITNTVIGLFLGVSVGATALIARYFGAKNEEDLQKSIHTSIVMAFIFSAVFTVAGICITPWMLRLMNTPPEVYDVAALYLRIYFAGVTGTILYNMCSGILRAVGNSKHPLYLLFVAAAVNVVLDILFVAVLSWGVTGAALATILSQLLSGVLLLWGLFRTKNIYRVEFRKFKISGPHLKRILWIGIPAGLQRTITQFSNVLVLRYINGFGEASMAAWGVYNHIHQFVLMPLQSLSMAATAFCGQNYGAGKHDRIFRGTRDILLISCGVTVFFSVLSVLFNQPLCKLFNSDADVLAYATLFVRVQMSLSVISCAGQIYAGSLRGLGDSKTPMVLLLLSLVVIRQIYLFIFSRLFDSIYVSVLGFPVGWLCSSLLCGIYYAKKKRQLLKEEPDHGRSL